MNTTAQDWMAQVQFGQLAANKGGRGQVRELGDRMVVDYAKNSDELKRIATLKGVDLPEDISPAQRREFHWLAKLSGAEFDHEYAKRVRSLQLKDVRHLRVNARSVRDPDLKAFAQSSLPVIEEQLEYVVFAVAMI